MYAMNSPIDYRYWHDIAPYVVLIITLFVLLIDERHLSEYVIQIIVEYMICNLKFNLAHKSWYEHIENFS
jgi:hypothetical protein